MLIYVRNSAYESIKRQTNDLPDYEVGLVFGTNLGLEKG